MKKRNIILILFLLLIIGFFIIWINWPENRLEEKGFSVDTSSSNDDDELVSEGISKDSIKFETQPSNVIITGIPSVRLTTVYKVNVNKKYGTRFIGSNNYLFNETELEKGNNWNGNIVPGLEGINGYNLVNISHNDVITNKKTLFFNKPVLIKTLYYPAFSNDTLNNKVVKRNFFLVSVYNDDTNKDNFINLKDLRRFYLFNKNGEYLSKIVPENYSVYKSEYDSENDFMFIFARCDKNLNGQIDDNEPINIFWIDLKDPTKMGQQY